MFNSVQCLKWERGVSEVEGTVTGAAALAGPAAPLAQQAVTTPPNSTTAATATAAGSLVSPAGMAAAPDPVPAAGIAAKPNNQPLPIAGAPVKLKKDAKRADLSGGDDNEPGSSREIETELITRSLSLGEL